MTIRDDRFKHRFGTRTSTILVIGATIRLSPAISSFREARVSPRRCYRTVPFTRKLSPFNGRQEILGADLEIQFSVMRTSRNGYQLFRGSTAYSRYTIG